MGRLRNTNGEIARDNHLLASGGSDEPGASPALSSATTLVGGSSPDPRGLGDGGHRFDERAHEKERASRKVPSTMPATSSPKKELIPKLSKLITAVPLVLALLPTAAGIMFNKSVGLVVTDTVLLIVLGWVLWGLSEGAWNMYRKAVLSQYSSFENEAALKKEQSGDKSEPASSTPPIPTATQPSPSSGTTRSLSSSYAGETAAMVVFLVLYLVSPFLGGALLHFAKDSFSSHTKLITNFNICLYVALEFLRNLSRLSDTKSYEIDAARDTNPSKTESDDPSATNSTNESKALSLQLTENELNIRAQEIADYALDQAARIMDRKMDRMQREMKMLNNKFTNNDICVKQVLGDVVTRLDRVSTEVAFMHGAPVQSPPLAHSQGPQRTSRHRRLSSDPSPRLGVLAEDEGDHTAGRVERAPRRELTMEAPTETHTLAVKATQTTSKPESKTQPLVILVIEQLLLPFFILKELYTLWKNIMLWPVRTTLRLLAQVAGTKAD